MRIKLIHLPRVYNDYDKKQCLLPPIGIALLKSALESNSYNVDQDDLNVKVDYDTKCSRNTLKKGVNLMLFEDKERVKRFLQTKNDPPLEEEAEKILKKTKYKGYDVTGLSLLDDLSFSVISVSLVISKLIKERTCATIVLGGLTYPRPMVEFEQFFNTGYVDYAIRDYGESAFLNLCYGLEKGCTNKLDIPGLLSREKKADVLKKPPYPPRKMSEFYRPNFDGLPLELYKYTPTGETRKLSSKRISILMLPYAFVNGCLNSCAFCAIANSDYGAQNPEIVAQDLKYLSGRYKTKYFFFLNTNVNPAHEYAMRLVKEFKAKDLNIMWNDSANFRQMDQELIKKLRDVGAVKLVYGLESPSDKILKYVGKGIDSGIAEKMLKTSHEAGIWNELDLIAGLPYETNDDINSCTAFLERNKEYTDYTHIARFVLKDSPMQRHPQQYGLVNISDNISTIYDIQWFARRFDEVKGLKWKQKRRQILRSFDTLTNKCHRLLDERISPYAPHLEPDLKYTPIPMPLLFYLYTALDSKEEVRAHFNQCYFDYVNDVPDKNIKVNHSGKLDCHKIRGVLKGFFRRYKHS